MHAHRGIRLFQLLIATSVPWICSRAQPEPEETRFSVEDCLRLAESAHPTLAAAQAAVEAASSEIDQARAAWWPQVDASAGYHRWQRRAFLPEGLGFPGMSLPEIVGPTDDWNAALTARATVLDFGQRKASIQAAQAQESASEASLSTARSNLRLAVQRAFYTLASANDMRAVAKRNLGRAEASAHLAEARLKAGAVPKADVLRAGAEVAQARLDVISALTQVRAAEGRLNNVMGRPASAAIQIAADVGEREPLPDADVAIAQALEVRPEIAAARMKVVATGAQTTAARAARAPKVRVDGSVGVRDVDFVPESKEWQAGVSVDLSIFDGGLRKSRVARARAERRRAEAQLASLELDVRDEVWSALAELERAGAAIPAREALVQQHEETVRVIKARYEAGSALIVELLDTQTALASAEAQLARARWDYRLAEAQYRRAVGADAAQ